LVTLTGFEAPEELEELAFHMVKDGNIKEGLKLILRAAKKYEEAGRKLEAARLYRYFGFVLLEKTRSLEKARPSLLKSAYLYIDQISEEIERPEVDIDLLDRLCFSVLEIFLAINDVKNLEKYASEFAEMYYELGVAYEENNDVLSAIRAYEASYHYHRMVNGEEGMRKTAESLITLYGQVAEERLENGDVAGAAEAFYELAWYIQAIFGYDIHFIEMMDTAAKNFEKASKIAYSNGDLDGTTTYLVKAEYAYLLSKNPNRAKLIGLNTARMLNQIISSYRAEGDTDSTAEKIMELAEALIGIGKHEEGIQAYKVALETKSAIEFRIRIRTAVIKRYCPQTGDVELLRALHSIEYDMKKGNHLRALDTAEDTLQNKDELGKILQDIHEAEGIYQ
jgi:tetratricopeptide (TPR) repeat protein